jgi:hypothetical protein
MARKLGRVAKQPEDDPIINLLIGVVKQAQRDLAYRSDSRSPLAPNAQERATAAQFLGEMSESARRHESNSD